MSGGVLAAVLTAALLHASWNAAIKGRSGDPHVGTVGLSAVWGLLGLGLVPLGEGIPAAALPSLVGSVAVHLVYLSLLVRAYGMGDLSYVYPIARGVPPILVALASGAVFGEPLSPLAMVGVVAIGAGVLGLGRPGGTLDLRLLAVALGTASCTAVYTLLDGAAIRAGAAPASYAALLFGLQGSAFALGSAARGGRDLIRRVWDRRLTALATGTMSAVGYVVVLWAMDHAPVALVAALRETSVVFAALLGWRLLGEPLGPRRVAAAAVVAGGAVLIRLGS